MDSLIKRKEVLLRYYGEYSILDEGVALQEMQKFLLPLSSHSFNLPLYYEVDRAEAKKWAERSSPAPPSAAPEAIETLAVTVEDLTQSTIETLGTLKDSGTNLATTLADSIWRAAPSSSLFSSIFSAPPRTESEELDDLSRPPEQPPGPPAVVDYAHTVVLRKSPGQGLGLDVAIDPDHGLAIRGVTRDSVAKKSGKFCQGDKILKIDGATTLGWSLDKVVEVLRASPEEVILVVATQRREPAHSTPEVASSQQPPKLSPVEIDITKGPTGFGVELGEADPQGVFIARVVPSGPAALTGRITAGDLITDINGKNLAGWTPAQAVAFLRSCTTVRLTLIPKK